ncbi:MAG: outer membrane protein [Candidatus Azotimanducaceae bacterium]|jgi:outer membrane protein
MIRLRQINFVVFLFLLMIANPSNAADQYLVLGSYGELENAQRFREIVHSKLGTRPKIASFAINGKRIYRVMAGPGTAALAANLHKESFDFWWLGKITEESFDWVDDVTLLGESPQEIEVLAKSPDQVSEPASAPKLTQSSTPLRYSLSVQEAIRSVLENNLQFVISDLSVQIANTRVTQARSALLPQVVSRFAQSAIDEDRASASNGRAPEFRSSLNLSIEQVIYSEPERAQYVIQKILQEASNQQRDEEVLRVIYKTLQVFLSAANQDALEKVIENDLDLTRKNLVRAEVRLQLGVADLTEVLRWQIQLASGNINLANARAARKEAIIQLYQLMNLPIDDAIELQPPSLDDPSLLLSVAAFRQTFVAALEQPEFIDFWSTEALRYSPTLGRLAKEKEAQQRTLLAIKRGTTIPSIKLGLNATKYLSQQGSGTQELDFEFPGSDARFGGATDNFEWSGTISAELPIYRGGKNSSQIKEERIRYAQIQTRYDEAVATVRANIRRSSARSLATWSSIEFSREAAQASNQNLDLVSDSYEKGVVTILDLLDAQAVALRAEVRAINSFHNFLLDYFSLQNDTGRFDVLLPSNETDELSARMIRSLSANTRH